MPRWSPMTMYDPMSPDHSEMMPRDSTAPRSDSPAARRPVATVPRPRPSASPESGLIRDPDRQAFLDILSHELRTPVTTIYGGAELLAKRDLKGERRRALAEDVRVEADRLYRLVEDLVILVNSERDEIRPVGEPVAVGHLVSAAIEREVTRHPGVKISMLGAADAAADGADEAMVTHVIRNLLDNAIRYGGEAGPIEVVVEVTSNEVAVRVNDHGVAPEPDERPFELSAHPAATAAGRAGAGIGLYVADRLVRAMGGRMWAEPSAGTGAEYGFALARSANGRSATARPGHA
jgi:K+-sensing histidine kinase KdpD